ncbi:D-aminoacyl-tRNA deacylase [Staphylococcus massiliensis]|uniref:D-aminoacyl-tRNA deacylase n=1 Tax=Staphylococcus massiliensis S46 TaxID=1229783 RepID=K9AV56_9STAP|nr:D-aminoacyl-tRNA deacylase [Staphylococcus massiliensis]EKU49971.1 D-tyrosyl-tRNA(Tyr) deacylase [Staphylococcus massiliensis S46]MCG3399074.1 D-tyrosyl-tRNA(Tyr) deacylase [Staphylococcus massiliensis]MCG3400928.1 D-tyrosyl-tRNA(Tyr) deacylase [Staphylococcus massiliensis]MCG3412465.1 D-tyrosyl-tRNA(Tyr) deacylase [Staphylococcus massiliensis]POA01763.1 D-tyrosyl-tRNA(Tyr) deacylase [Staphylococcus massiliensis CCUG 55927]
MRIVLQRVKSAKVSFDKEEHAIQKGFCLLVGVGKDSTKEDAEVLARKIANTRLFEDENGKMNLNIQAVSGEILSISQFTLYADVHKGNRPSFMNAMSPEEANSLYEYFNESLSQYDIPVQTGAFGQDMTVDIVNDGPVTIIFESQDGKVK